MITKFISLQDYHSLINVSEVNKISVNQKDSFVAITLEVKNEQPLDVLLFNDMNSANSAYSTIEKFIASNNQNILYISQGEREETPTEEVPVEEVDDEGESESVD